MLWFFLMIMFSTLGVSEPPLSTVSVSVPSAGRTDVVSVHWKISQGVLECFSSVCIYVYTTLSL